MATHDYNIANQGFPAFRSDLNNSLSAIVSNNSSATQPSTTYAYQWWYDTSTDTLKFRNADNDDWVSFATFDMANDTVNFLDSTVTIGDGTITFAKLDSSNQSFLKSIPQSGSAKTGSYTLTTSDLGSFIEVGSGGSITIPDATFSAGNAISLFNNTTGDITITCSITTAYISGTDTDKATVTLATRGVATILFISGTVCVISGSVT